MQGNITKLDAEPAKTPSFSEDPLPSITNRELMNNNNSIETADKNISLENTIGEGPEDWYYSQVKTKILVTKLIFIIAAVITTGLSLYYIYEN